MPLPDYRKLIPDLGPVRSYDGPTKFSTHAQLREEFKRLGFKCKEERGVLIVLGTGGVCAFIESETSFTSLLGFRILKDKQLANRFLSRSGISVAEQHAFAADNLAEAKQVVERLGSAVVKPVNGNQGRGVTVGVTVDTLREAWDVAANETTASILVESHFQNAVEARYLVIDGTCVAVIRRVPPHIRGDGRSTIEALIAERNAVRLRNPNLTRLPIKLNDHRLRIIAEQGFGVGSVPPDGALVLIDTKAGLSTGGEAMDITDEVHPGMREIAERASRIVPGLDVVGFDILARDHQQEPSADSYIVVEGNTRPGLGGHMYPSYGQPRNVCRMIATYCAGKMRSDGTEARVENSAQPVKAAPRKLKITERDEEGLPYVPVPSLADMTDRTGTLVLGGDTCLGHSYLTRKWPEARERLRTAPESFFTELAPLVADADAFIVNLETVLGDNPPDVFSGQKKYLGWDNPKRTLATLRSVGVTAVTLANNHVLDFGQDRAAETVRRLSRAGIPAAGFGLSATEAGAPLRLSVGGVTVFVFPAFEFRESYHKTYHFYAGSGRPGVCSLTTGARLARRIGPYRQAYPDSFIIFAPHWGGIRNYDWATEKMVGLGAEALAAGADAVIGHGAHALQELDFGQGGAVVYSIGNFVFNSPGRYESMQGFPFSLVARLALSPGRAGLRLYPFFCDNKATAFKNRPVNAEEFDEVVRTLQARPIPQEPLLDHVTCGRDARGYYLAPTGPLSPRFGSL